MKRKNLKIPNPSNLLQKLPQEAVNACCLTGKGWENIFAFNPCEKFILQNKKLDIKTLQNFVKKHQKKNHKIIGYFSYDLAYQLHNVPQKASNDLKLPLIYLLAFDNYISWSQSPKKAIAHYTNPDFLEQLKSISKNKIELPKTTFKNKNFSAQITAEQYHKAYKKVKEYINKGHVYQMNLTHRLKAETGLSPRYLFKAIHQSNKADFSAYIEGEGFDILSASPERFIKIENNKIETYPVKGTKARGQTKEEDQQMRQELLNSPKEAAELNMITDLLRNDLGKIAKIGSVKVEKNRSIIKHKTVWHTYSKISAELHPKINSIEALISMLPGGSISGCPKKRAIEIIDELEPTTRSVYTGCIGQINSNSDLDFNIAIRTIIKKGSKLFLQVGGGIVLDSKEKAEFKETLQKAKSFMKILC